MYLKNITLKNVGPLASIAYEFPFEQDCPVPVVIVGTNGSGKSIFLSHLLNPLLLAQQAAFDNPETVANQVYKLRSPQYIKLGESFSYSKLSFGNDFVCEEWQLSAGRGEFEKKHGKPDFGDSFSEIREHETSSFKAPYYEDKIEMERQFRINTVLYFPPSRFEQPAWHNERSLNASASFTDFKNIQRESRRQIIQNAPLSVSKDWLLDIICDRAVYEGRIYDAKQIGIDALGVRVFVGYLGRASMIFDQIGRLLKLLLRTDDNVRFGIGPRQLRNVSIMRNELPGIHNIFQLSSGQTAILNIMLSILRDHDLSGAPFGKLEDVRGVVIIDEVDLHLHSDLQCNVLPKVIKLFPKVQFVLTTHSPLFLLGMKATFGDRGFEVLSLPSGDTIGLEEFEEFRTAFDFYEDSDLYRSKLETAIGDSRKPVIFVEGDYDIRYIRKVAAIFGREQLLAKINLLDANGFGGLNNIWKISDSKLCMAFPFTVGLIYDCDIEKKDASRKMFKRRTVPSISENPISKGIENLFPPATIAELRRCIPKFFDISESHRRSERGTSVVIPEQISVNPDEKRNVCDWLCTKGTREDFRHFETLFDIISEIAEIPNGADVDVERLDSVESNALTTIQDAAMTSDASKTAGLEFSTDAFTPTHDQLSSEILATALEATSSQNEAIDEDVRGESNENFP